MTSEPFDAAVVIGQFQPFVEAEHALLTHALQIAPRVWVVVDSAYAARTPRGPWLGEERAACIQGALSKAERERVRWVFVRDHYHEGHRCADIVQQVSAQLPPSSKVALVVHQEELNSPQLAKFEADFAAKRLPPWRLVAGPARGTLASEAALRDDYFGAGEAALPALLARAAASLPPSTLQALEAFAATPAYAELAAEWRALRDYRAAWSRAPFSPVFVTVDAVVTCRQHVLSIRRGRSPGKGLLALPGGFLEQAETTLESALRELEEETRLTLPVAVREPVRSAVFDHPRRSQRGRTITHAFHFDLGDVELPVVAAADDASEARWVPISSLVSLESQLFDDHFHILDTFLRLL